MCLKLEGDTKAAVMAVMDVRIIGCKSGKQGNPGMLNQIIGHLIEKTGVFRAQGYECHKLALPCVY